MGPLYVVIRDESAFDRIIEIGSCKALIGRRETCDVWLPDPVVSREHAQLVRTSEGYRIRDLGSRNGTFLNGHPMRSEELLRDGSEAIIGRYRLTMHLRVATVIRRSSESDDSTETENGAQHSLGPLRTYEPKLTAAQNRVYLLLLEGQQEKEIAKSLGISIHTVHWHVKAIYRIFSVATRSELLYLRLRR